MPVGGCLNSSISACKLSPCLIPQTATGLPGTCSVSRCSKPSSVPSVSASILCEQPGESPPVPIVCTPPGRKLSHRLLDHIALISHGPLSPFCFPLSQMCQALCLWNLCLVSSAVKLSSPLLLVCSKCLFGGSAHFFLLCSIFSVVGLALCYAVSF